MRDRRLGAVLCAALLLVVLGGCRTPEPQDLSGPVAVVETEPTQPPTAGTQPEPTEGEVPAEPAVSGPAETPTEPAEAEMPTGPERSGEAGESAEPEEVPAEVDYDEAAETLAFPGLGLRCTLPAAAMEHLRVDRWTVETESERELGKPHTITHLYFKYAVGDTAYKMFLVSIWDAAEWDIPREYGPLPLEVTRSPDGSRVLVHGSSELVAKPPSGAENAAVAADVRGWIETWEGPVVASMALE